MFVAAGLPRVRPVGLFVEPTGWQAAETPDGAVELRAGDGGLWARGRPGCAGPAEAGQGPLTVRRRGHG
ncbi:MAG: hypothetical protein ACREMG_01330, partial [Gemmatimonadales bacterium]